MSAAEELVFHKVDKARWDDFAALFESRGAPSYCWCMAWRATAAEARAMKNPERKAAMRKRVREGVPIGILGYFDGEPVAWCSIAPRSTYRPLGGLERAGEAEADVWSLACFYLKRSMRGQGLGRQTLDAEGARVVEAYPVAPDSPSYRFMGFVPAFEKAGFSEVGRAGSRRHVMRLEV